MERSAYVPSGGGDEMRTVLCPECGRPGHVPEGHTGWSMRCRACGFVFVLEKASGNRRSAPQPEPSSSTKELEPPPRAPAKPEYRRNEPAIARSLRCGRCSEEFASPVEVSFKCPKCDGPLAGYARGLVGRPGEVWINNTDRILYQYVPTFDLSCGGCLQYASKISLWWSKMHRGCNCRSHPIHPGQTSLPFIDFREKLDSLDSEQQHASTGKCSWILLKAGIVAWEDVVTSCRVREFHEVMDRQKLSIEVMLRAGVPAEDASKAWQLVYTPERLASDAQMREAIKGLRELGLSAADIKNTLARRLASRVVGTGEQSRSDP